MPQVFHDVDLIGLYWEQILSELYQWSKLMPLYNLVNA